METKICYEAIGGLLKVMEKEDLAKLCIEYMICTECGNDLITTKKTDAGKKMVCLSCGSKFFHEEVHP